MKTSHYHYLISTTLHKLCGTYNPSIDNLHDSCVRILLDEDCLLNERARAKSISNKLILHIQEQTGIKLKKSKSLELVSECLGYENWNELCDCNSEEKLGISPCDWINSCNITIKEINTTVIDDEAGSSRAKYNVVQNLVLAKKILSTQDNFEDFFQYFSNSILVVKTFEEQFKSTDNKLLELIDDIGKIEFNTFLYRYDSPEIWKRIGLYYGSVFLNINQNVYEHSLKRLFSVFFTNLVRLSRMGDNQTHLADTSIDFLQQIRTSFK